MPRIADVLIITTVVALAGSTARDEATAADFFPASSEVARHSEQNPPAPPATPPGEQPDQAAPPGDRPGPPQGLPDRDWRDRGGFRFTPENREHVLAVIADLRPLSDDERERLAAMSFDELRQFLAEQGGMILGLARLRETQPELYELRVADIKLLRQIQEEIQNVRTAREAGGGDPLAAAEERLRGLVSEQIDLRFAIREREIRALEERVAAMRQELERERQQPRDELIDRRLEIFESGERDWRRDGPRHESSPDGQAPKPPGPASGGDDPPHDREGGSE